MIWDIMIIIGSLWLGRKHPGKNDKILIRKNMINHDYTMKWTYFTQVFLLQVSWQQPRMEQSIFAYEKKWVWHWQPGTQKPCTCLPDNILWNMIWCSPNHGRHITGFKDLQNRSFWRKLEPFWNHFHTSLKILKLDLIQPQPWQTQGCKTWVWVWLLSWGIIMLG